MSDINEDDKAAIIDAAIKINRIQYFGGSYGKYAGVTQEGAAVLLVTEALKAAGWEIVPAGALSTAREEGRLEGLEEAAKVADEYDFRSNTEEDVQAYRIATAIRALKEKQL